MTALNGGNTDASGQAIAIYTAGSLTRPRGPGHRGGQHRGGGLRRRHHHPHGEHRLPAFGYQVTLTAGTPSLAAGENSILTARVTDNSGTAVSGQTVNFRFVGGAAPSGATLTPLNGGNTDASGQAIAVYTAGSLTPASALQDVVEATLVGASDVAILIRTSSTAIPPAGSRLALAADLTSLAAGQNAVLTATVTNVSGTPVGGQRVTFVLLSNTTGATLATLGGGVTDPAGRAVAIYTAGNNTPAVSLQDTIQASVTGSTGAVVMTRTAEGGGGVGGVRMNVTATPTSLNAGSLSVIVAEVLNASGSPVAGQAVAFTFVTNNSGATLTTVNATQMRAERRWPRTRQATIPPA